MIRYYEKIIKREIRKTKRFRKNSTIKIIGLASNVYNFSIDLIRKISERNNLNLKIIENLYENLTDIMLEENAILIIPLEGVFLSYIIYLLNQDKKYYDLFKKYRNLNIGYKISEFLLSKYTKKDPFRIDEKYYFFIDFLYKVFEKNEKYALSLGKFMEHIEKYY